MLPTSTSTWKIILAASKPSRISTRTWRRLVPFQPEQEAASFRAANIDIFHTRISEQLFRQCLFIAILCARFRNQRSVRSEGFQREQSSAIDFGNSAIAGESRTYLRVDVNRARRWRHV